MDEVIEIPDSILYPNHTSNKRSLQILYFIFDKPSSTTSFMKWSYLPIIFIRRYPLFGGRFLYSVGKCKIAALNVEKYPSVKA